ncbi:hypothetical protein pb186bvf_008571 [Paramecium bursaria]
MDENEEQKEYEQYYAQVQPSQADLEFTQNIRNLYSNQSRIEQVQTQIFTYYENTQYYKVEGIIRSCINEYVQKLFKQVDSNQSQIEFQWNFAQQLEHNSKLIQQLVDIYYNMYSTPGLQLDNTDWVSLHFLDQNNVPRLDTRKIRKEFKEHLNIKKVELVQVLETKQMKKTQNKALDEVQEFERRISSYHPSRDKIEPFLPQTWLKCIEGKLKKSKK